MKTFFTTIHPHSRIGKLSYHFRDLTKMVALSILILLPFSCRHENAPSDTQRVTFYVDALSVDRDSITTSGDGVPSPSLAPSASPSDISLEQANMTDLWLFEGTTLLAHQTSGDAEFGTPSIELSYGHHTITFIASPQPDQTFTAGTWHAGKAADTFGYVADIDVTTSASTEQIILNRLTYGLKWQSTDIVPASVRTLRLRVSPMRESIVAGLHATNGYERTYTYDVSDYIGRVVGVTIYGLPEHYGVEDAVTSTIEFLDASNNILFTHTRTVPVLSNRRTIITGALFNGSASAPVRINSEWLTDYETSL